MSDTKSKRFYFDRDTLKNIGQRDTVMRYLKGIIHQDKMLFIRTSYLPTLGLDPSTPFRILDENGDPVAEYDFQAEEQAASKLPGWISIEIPANVDVKQKPTKNAKGKTS